jgi:uncharacterized protein YjeT (DUF2065 family)
MLPSILPTCWDRAVSSMLALNRDVFAVSCKIQRRIGLAVLAVTVGQLAYKAARYYF